MRRWSSWSASLKVGVMVAAVALLGLALGAAWSKAPQQGAAYSMMLTGGVFRRGGPPKPDAEWELIAVEDPHGLASVNRLVHWRRSMPTINFPVGSVTVNWDAAANIGKGQRAALVNLTNRLVTGALQGPP